MKNDFAATLRPEAFAGAKLWSLIFRDLPTRRGKGNWGPCEDSTSQVPCSLGPPIIGTQPYGSESRQGKPETMLKDIKMPLEFQE